MSKTTVVSIRRAMPAKVSRTVKTVKPRRKRQPALPGLRYSPGANEFLTAYTKTLNDPFEYPGVPLGYDCFLPTTQAAAYSRGSFTVNADGSFSILMHPDVQNFVLPVNSAKAAVFGTTANPAANVGSLQNNFSEIRIVSGGLRVFVLFPETSASGVIFSGALPDQSRTGYGAFSNTTLSAIPESRLGIGSKGATSLIRPYDNGSFEFYSGPLNGMGVTTLPYMTSSYILGQGFPVNSVVWYEAILNIEGIANSTSVSSAIPSDDMPAPSGASSFFPTPGELFAAASRYLSPSALLDAGLAALQYSGGNYSGAARTLMNASSRIGYGTNFNSYSQRRSRESSVMIEEMKEDGSYIRLRR